MDDFENQALYDFISQYGTVDPYGPGSGWGQDTLSAMGIANDTEPGGWDKFLGAIRSIPGIGKTASGFLKTAAPAAGDFLTSRAGVAGLTALLSLLDRQKQAGGGAGVAYAGPAPLQRQIVQGKYGPIARYAAQGGIMHAYANGGAVRPFPMQDGGFVLTADAVKGAGGFDGMSQRVPEAVPIRGPGHGTSDSIPAYIQGPNGRTPAKVSNGEMYVPPGRDTRGLYALMRAMERKA
jgi:hypothetical protein